MKIKLLKILELIHAHDMDRTRSFAFDILYEQYPPKQVDAKFEKIYRKGYIECGVSVRTGWLTGKGLAKLYELREVNQEIRPLPLHPAVIKMLKEEENC